MNYFNNLFNDRKLREAFKLKKKPYKYEESSNIRNY